MVNNIPYIGTQTLLCTRRRTRMHHTGPPVSRTGLARSQHYTSNCTWSRLRVVCSTVMGNLLRACVTTEHRYTHSHEGPKNASLHWQTQPHGLVESMAHVPCKCQDWRHRYEAPKLFKNKRKVTYPSCALGAIECWTSPARSRTFTRVSAPFRIAFALATCAFAPPRANGPVAAARACILARGT